MASTFSIAAEPFWYIVNNAGTSAGGAKLYTRRALNHDEDKTTYQSASNTTAWSNPIIFGLNGVAPGPIFWEFDPAQPDELYYIFVNDAEGNLIWDMNNFSGQGGSGGGGNTTTYLPLINYITNNQFIDHIDDITNPGTNLVIAPSNHKGFTPSPTAVTPVIGTWGAVGSDIRFVKNAAGTPGTDAISFVTFDLADPALGASDVTPVEYVKYTCSSAATGEQFKAFQFPITQKVKNLSNQIMTFKVWAKVAATAKTIPVFVRQYYGSNTAVASPEVHFQAGTINLTTTWTEYTIAVTIPNVADGGATLGAVGSQTDDDALYIQLGMPLDQLSEIWFIKPKLYLGSITNSKEFDEYDEINSINSTPRTGDIRVSLTPNPPKGWVAMDDKPIGNVGSGATGRANKDTFQLYTTLYTSVSDTYAPVSGGRTGTTMSAAITDFLANKTLTLPKSLGRALAGAGAATASTTARALGQTVGSEVITIAGMPSHNHPGSVVPVAVGTAAAGGFAVGATNFATAVNVASQGGGTLNVQGAADGNMPPTSFMNVFIKL